MDRFLEGVINGILNDRRAIYNPTLFYGNSSDLKVVVTRLTQGYREKHPLRKMVTISGEEFTHKMILSIKEGTNLDFKKQFENTDFLIFEGVEMIAGRLTTMQKFYGLFDKVIESVGQIIITSTVPPSKISLLEDRIRTQLEAGLICAVRAQDL